MTDEVTSHPVFSQELEQLLARARNSWPGVSVEVEKFIAYLEKLIDLEDPMSSLRKLKIRDLYLAFACVNGDEHALLFFESTFIPIVRRNIGKLHLSDSVREEIVQRVRYKLLVRLPHAAPKLAQYNGSSDLAVWLRVVALRQTLDFVKARDQKDLPLTDAELADRIIDCDQEILLIKKQYQGEFEGALKEALTSLDTKERNLLRASVLDKLTIDEIGGLYQVHRATAARWLVRIRTGLKDQIKQRLKLRLDLDTHEYDKIAEVLNSQLNLSLSRILSLSVPGGSSEPSRGSR